MSEELWSVVQMVEVPNPPVARAGRFLAQIEALLKLRPDMAHRMAVSGPKELNHIRGKLRAHAKTHGRRLLSSRNKENNVLWVWLEPVKAVDEKGPRR